MKIALTGSSGFVASQLIPILVADGHSVLLVTTSPDTCSNRFPGMRVASLSDWEKSAENFDLILHLGAINNNRVASSDEFYKVNSELSGEIAAKASRLGIRRFVFVSSLHALDPTKASSYALSKRAGKDAVCNGFGSDAETIYLGAVYGDRFSGKLKFLNYFPPQFRRAALALLSAWAPVTNVNLIAKHVKNGSAGAALLGRTVLTDSIHHNLFYRTFTCVANYSFVLMTILFSPVLAAFWVGVILGGGRPGLHSQLRIGLKEKRFTCRKLRTLPVDTPQVGTHLINQHGGSKLGRFLRQSKLDELPQAINVMMGEMNLVGPRPSLPNQEEVIGRRRELGVFKIKPGLAGWAQLNGADMSAPFELATLDWQYLSLRSVSWDIKILLNTLKRQG